MTAAPSARATQAGILLMISASLTFGAQDGLSRLLAESYGPVTVIAIRFWFSALFVLAFAATRPGGIRRVAKSKRPVFQTLRGLLLITQICTAVYGFTMVGLVGYQVISRYQLPWPAGRGIDTATVIQQLSNSPPFTSSTAQLKYSTLPRLVSMKTSKLTRSPSPGTGTMRWLA